MFINRKGNNAEDSGHENNEKESADQTAEAAASEAMEVEEKTGEQQIMNGDSGVER